MTDILASRLSRLPGVLSRRVKPDEPTTVLLNEQSGEYYTLDEVGSRVWELCDGTKTASDIVAAVAAEYDAPVEVIERDVLELLNDLAADQLVIGNP